MTAKNIILHQMRVGAFVAIGLVITLISLFTVGGDRFMKSYVILHAQFEHVDGLNEGSIVSLQGISVGNVRGFVFLAEKGKVDVEMKVDRAFLKLITEGSKVEMRTAGALGDKFVFITLGPSSAPALKDGDTLEVEPAADIMTMISQKGSDAGKVFDIIRDVQKITATLTADDRIEKLMRNLTDASQSIKETSRETKELISEVRTQDTKKLASAMDKMDRILGKIDQGQGTLGALINDSSLHDSLKALIGGPDRKKSIKYLIRSSIEKSEKE